MRVTRERRLLAHLAVREGGPSVPVTTALIPGAWRTLAQPPEGAGLWRLTAVGAARQVRSARLSVVVGAAFHPALEAARPVLTLGAPSFRMVFPLPRTLPPAELTGR